MGRKVRREITDIFTVEDSISEQVAAALTLKLTGEEQRLLRKHYTEDTEAYQAYLKGRYFWNKRSIESLNRGVEYFREAIDLDPTYASAIVHAGLGENDQAFEWLQDAFERHSVDLFTISVEPMLDVLRSDPRFDRLLFGVGLASPEMNKGNA